MSQHREIRNGILYISPVHKSELELTVPGLEESGYYATDWVAARIESQARQIEGLLAEIAIKDRIIANQNVALRQALDNVAKLHQRLAVQGINQAIERTRPGVPRR